VSGVSNRKLSIELAGSRTCAALDMARVPVPAPAPIVAPNSFCQIEYVTSGSDVGTLGGKPAVAKCGGNSSPGA